MHTDGTDKPHVTDNSAMPRYFTGVIGKQYNYEYRSLEFLASCIEHFIKNENKLQSDAQNHVGGDHDAQMSYCKHDILGMLTKLAEILPINRDEARQITASLAKLASASDREGTSAAYTQLAQMITRIRSRIVPQMGDASIRRFGNEVGTHNQEMLRYMHEIVTSDNNRRDDPFTYSLRETGGLLSKLKKTTELGLALYELHKNVVLLINESKWGAATDMPLFENASVVNTDVLIEKFVTQANRADREWKSKKLEIPANATEEKSRHAITLEELVENIQQAKSQEDLEYSHKLLQNSENKVAGKFMARLIKAYTGDYATMQDSLRKYDRQSFRDNPRGSAFNSSPDAMIAAGYEAKSADCADKLLGIMQRYKTLLVDPSVESIKQPLPLPSIEGKTTVHMGAPKPARGIQDKD